MSTRIDERRSEAWLEALRESGPAREEALAQLHALLLRGARFELRRRDVARDELEDLATQAADDALVAILAKLESFRGASRFTTWAYKFVLLEAGVKARRRAWQEREVALDELASPVARSIHESLEASELLRAIAGAIERDLTPRQRAVLCALAIDGVPIDVLADRLGTTRGALYKVLHDARRKLRASLAAAGHTIDGGGHER